MNRFTLLSALLGVVLVTAGAAWIYRPLGPLACGSLLLAAAFTSARKLSKG